MERRSCSTFIAEAEKDHLEIREVSGRRIKEILSDTFALPPETAKAATETMDTAPTGSE
ncbi:MAG: hypothetical protein ABSE50_12315 [Xanthobacteraceae bacterium]